eukprot:202325-Pleurochrysis_carterae.AAC.4
MLGRREIAAKRGERSLSTHQQKGATPDNHGSGTSTFAKQMAQTLVTRLNAAIAYVSQEDMEATATYKADAKES